MPNFQGAVNSIIGSLYRAKSISKIMYQGESASKIAKRQLQETVKQRQEYIREFKMFKREAYEAMMSIEQARAEGVEQERLRRQTLYLDRFNKIYGGDTNGTTPTA